MSQTLPRFDEGTLHYQPENSTQVLSVSGTLPLDQSGPHVRLLGSTLDATVEDAPRPPVVELAIPVFNEELTLEANVRRLRSYLDESFPFEAVVRIVDNASTDGTWAVATRLAAALHGVTALRLEQKGKGRAVRAAWTTSTAQIVAYMDVDLSTDLGGLLPLVAPLLSGHSDVAIGSRLAPGAHVLRGARREVVSRGYQLLLRLVLRNQFSDATCGFKAARRETAEILLPLVSDEHWFFDTEFLVLAEWNGFRIHEVPVDWIDDSDSRVNIRSVTQGNLRGIARLARNKATRQKMGLASADGSKQRGHSGHGTRYAGVGVLSTIAYVAIFLALRNVIGMYAANIVAFAISTVGSVVGHVYFTFGPKSGVRMRHAAIAGLLGFATGVTLTTLALGVEVMLGMSSATTEAMAILLGVVAAGFVRLILFRASAYHTHTQSVRTPRLIDA